MRSIALAIVAAAALLLSPWIINHVIADKAEQQICDIGADYALGVEDYSEAIRRHIEIVRKHPDNALAHYHLGFAQGMLSDRIAELKEYQRAEALGLKTWDLFLNVGLAKLESGDLVAASHSLRRAVLLGPNHPEAHFNLALVDYRRGMLADAEREALVSLHLNPEQPDTRNLLGVIYAQQGKTASASLVWRDLVHDVPGYEPASRNLAILGSTSEVAIGETAAELPRAAAVTAISDERELRPTSKGQINTLPARYEGW